MKKKRIVDARNDSNGNVEAVRFDGNQTFTSIERVIPIAERGEIDRAHVVHPARGKAYLRSNSDGNDRNNLDWLAEN